MAHIEANYHTLTLTTLKDGSLMRKHLPESEKSGQTLSVMHDWKLDIFSYLTMFNRMQRPFLLT